MNYRNLRHKVVGIINNVRTYKNGLDAKKEMKNHISEGRIYEGSDKEYQEVVVPFWEKYNFVPNKEWFQYYGQLEQKFDPRFIPGDFFQSKLMPFLNNFNMQSTLENKFYFDMILKELDKPYNIFKQVNGYIMDNDNQLITKEEGLEKLNSYSKVIIKPTNSSGGKGVKILDLINNREESLKLIDKYFESDFVVQELIIQSPQLSKYNKSSVNTVRINTLLLNGRVEVISKIIRIGQEGADVDNYSAGGQRRVIDDNGVLLPYLYSKKGFVYTDRDGNDLQPEKLKGIESIIELVKKYHPRFPHLRWIGWDFAIDEDYKPVFIEMNGFAIENQVNDGPMFKEFTKEILDEYFNSIKKNG